MGWFKKVNPFVQSLSGWVWIGSVLLTGFYALLGFFSPVFEGLHWTAVVLLAIAMSLATLFTLVSLLAIAAWTYRTIWPLPAAVTRSAVAAEPQTQSIPPLRKLTAAERERASEALCELLDFVDNDIQPLHHQVYTAILKSPAIPELETVGIAKIMALTGKAHTLPRKHSHFLDLMKIDPTPLRTSVEQMEVAMDGALQAKSWPPPAQSDKIKSLDTKLSDLAREAAAFRELIAEKRREYIEV